MGMWDTYESRINAHGGTKYNASYIRESRAINMKIRGNLSYHQVEIFPQKFGFNINSDESKIHSFFQTVTIINSDNLNEKTILSLPSENIELGSLVHWMDNYWLVSEKDPNTTVYSRAKLLQCNHLLKWISDDIEKRIMEQWCVIEDGTKYLTGEYEDRNFVVTRGDSRISMQIARNQYTVAFDRERRFLIDDPDSPHKLAYLLTKPLKRGLTYNEQGTFKFVLQEVTATDYDNHELGIADYYKYFPEQKGKDEPLIEDENYNPPAKRKVWI